ncbi:SsgA family sporulation/cell division regulator [Streptacidiphilus monticola]|uniref:SsgA family sporulation/cell division regulator n=1 Tax=Streptacidiphilus monticola TaxID=2161674 RepID=A0ABW1FYA2_9ACTN
MHSLVKGQLVMNLLASEDLAFETDVQLSYDAADPFAVSLTFHLPGDPPVTWVFGRELLLDGISRPSGEGDVRIAPVPGPDADFCDVDIKLCSPGGAAVLRSPAVPLIAFLGRTDRVLPMGQEHTEDSLDRKLEEILGAA